MINDSFISMPKEEVIERCEKTIARIKHIRQEDDDHEYCNVMNNINKGWLRKLFRRPQVTIEEVKKEYETYIGYPFYPSCRGWGTLDAAERILRAARASKDDVYLSSSDLTYIT